MGSSSFPVLQALLLGLILVQTIVFSCLQYKQAMLEQSFSLKGVKENTMQFHLNMHDSDDVNLQSMRKETIFVGGSNITALFPKDISSLSADLVVGVLSKTTDSQRRNDIRGTRGARSFVTGEIQRPRIFFVVGKVC